MGQKKVLVAEPSCELGGSRTHNRLIRSQGLYPIELLVQSFLTLQKYSFFHSRKQKIDKIFISFRNQLIDKSLILSFSHRFHSLSWPAFIFLLFLPHQHQTILRYEIIIDQQLDQFRRELSGLGDDPNRAFLLAEPY